MNKDNNKSLFNLMIAKEMDKVKGITESIKLTKEDLILLRKKGRIYADGDLKNKLIEVVFDEKDNNN